ncbi:hypothetical protein EV195_104187 [Tenacibaculum skagerrakense]|uniref:Uncharacterized protein n=1 Tax=Tenacibaculum skagerrakense TaxID=186571 RepID=A0A4R2NUF8_9FLAO|nr:hypothetical protein [Tenacibaculum skagerrakense]TCP25154.1 hypothetical protein EV195_104187 [Tenacibaculum skagerrakense]
MKIQHLEERVIDYKESIKTVVDKKKLWEIETKKLIVNTLKNIVKQYDIGWIVQELNWINNNEAVNITFNSFPSELIDCTNQIPSYQFIQGGTLVFTESYSGDVYVFIMFPFVEQLDNTSLELGFYSPQEITEKLIVEKVDEFLKEMIKWEVPTHKNSLGFVRKEG